jgi:hypothetical protein
MVNKRQKMNENSSSQATAASVHFNVGGTPYQVSRSLLEQHADTMLARMASETWQGEDPPEEALFVERDGGRFGYVLDFMRDGQVSLPAKGKITEESLLKELTYFGFLNVDPSVITTEFHHLDIPRYMALITQEYNEELANKTEQRIALNLNIICTTVAHACCIRYMTTGNLNVCFDTSIQEGSFNYKARQKNETTALDYAVVAAVQGLKLPQKPLTEVLNQSLAKYGLHCVNYIGRMRRTSNAADSVTITLAKVE